MKRLLFSFTFLFVTLLCFSQKKVKYGTIDMADLTMTEYPTDNSANAAILYHKGYLNLEYNPSSDDFQYKYERHIRIKILDKSGLDWADFAISLYENGINREKILWFNATVFTDKNGTIEKTVVKKGDLLNDRVSENTVLKKIALPNVQEGSIIDIEYSILSPFYYNLEDWRFQYEVPVRYSEYQLNYPDWFSYKTNFKGYDLQYVNSMDLKPDTKEIVFHTKTGNNNVTYRRMRYGWIAKEMPAFIEDVYISTVDNFLVSIEIELESTQFPESNFVSLIKDWEKLVETLMKSNFFGRQLTKGKTKFLTADVLKEVAGVSNPRHKITAIYYYLKNIMEWNNYQDKYITTSLKEAYYTGKGNTADINLTLLSMLRLVGFNADPVLLSTKDNGFLNQGFPTLRQFNYVIIRVEVEVGKYMFLDATDKDLPLHLLPTKCINDSGLLVKKEGMEWIELKSTGKYNIVRTIDINLNEDMEWEGSMKVKYKDYAASSMRQMYEYEEDEATYLAAIESNHAGLAIDEFSIEGLAEFSSTIKETYSINFENQIIDEGDLLYFNPMLTFGTEENPFKLEERTYPVDYDYPMSETYSFQYTIPEGYRVDEMPEGTIIALPEKGGKFSYSTKIQGNKIIVSSQFKLNKNFFLPTEYQSLKEFYNIVVAKHSEQVVLKKI